MDAWLLQDVLDEFKCAYEHFTHRHYRHQIVCLEDTDIADVMHAAEIAGDIRESARVFESRISLVMESIKEREKLRDTTWMGKLANFLTKFYPLAQTFLQLSIAAGEARS